jgi:histidine kinase
MSDPTYHRRPPYRPWRGVSFRLTLWVGLCLIILTSIAAYAGSIVLERRAVQRTLQTSMWFSDTVKRATHFSMLRNQRDNMHQIIQAIGQQEGVEAVRVFNKQGRIMYSSRAQEIGHMVDMQAEACYACHFRDRPLERLPRAQRGRIFETKPGGDGQPHRVLGVINPIYTERACYSDPCHAHPASQKVLGVLDVGLSLAGVDKEVASTTREVAGVALLIFLSIAGLMAVITYFTLTRPLSTLVGATRRIAQGDYNHPAQIQSQDEIGALSQDFERMRLSVKEKTEALEESRRRFQTLFEQVPCYISVQDSDFKLVAVNNMFEGDFGREIGEYCYKAYKGRSSICPNCAVEKSFKDGLIHTAEETVVGKDGKSKYFLNLAAPIFDRDGEIIAVMEMATDVTDLRRLECELRESEEKYRLFFNNDPNAIFVFDQRTFEILDANDRATSEYRYLKKELIGRSFLDLTDPADQTKVRHFLAEGGNMLARVHHTRKGGEVFMVNMRASYGQYLDRMAVIVATADISETLKTEQHLVQAAKMATLGEMSAGVAHELNQPLTVLATSVNILNKQAQRQEGPETKTILQVALELKDQVERATRIINHLREFGRKAEVVRGKVDLAQPIEGVFQLLGQQLRVHDIEVKLDIPDNLPPVWGDANRFEQVFINLVMNARDAIEEKRLTNGDLQGCIKVSAAHAGGKVKVTFSDNGMGVPQDLSERIFEPFFTTKEVGKGTGLGLSISYGIVRDSGGAINVTSTPGRGASFCLSFPAALEDE